MGMPDTVRRWTRVDVLALPDDGNRYELIDGELLVTPAPRPAHQRAVLALYDRLKPYVERNRLGAVTLAPADLHFGRRYVSQPDLFVEPETDRRKLLDWRDYGVPIFIAEVLSPSTGRGDRTVKRPAYQRAGVGEYWIIDPDSRVVERWQPDDARPEISLTRAVWHPTPGILPFELELEPYFAEIWGQQVRTDPG